jgi:uncharacterized membrane protein
MTISSWPTLHPLTVHFPIAFLSLASLAGMAYLFWRPHPALLVLTWWPMRLGWLGGVLAIATGLLAQSGLPPNAPYRSVLNWHIGTGLALLVCYGWLIYQRWLFESRRARKDRTRQSDQPLDLLDDPNARNGFTLLALLGLLLIVVSGWTGGRLVYEWGVNVAR